MNESNIKDDHALSLGEMQDKLDGLWEKHLELLDQYHQAQTQLQKHMSKVSIVVIIHDPERPSLISTIGLLLSRSSLIQITHTHALWSGLL